MKIFISNNHIYMTENENFLPEFMKGKSLRELKYGEEEISVSVAALFLEKKKVVIKKITSFGKDEFSCFVSKNSLYRPLTPGLYQLFLDNVKGRGIVQLSSEKLDIIIIIIGDDLSDEHFDEDFKEFDLAHPGFIADRLNLILNNL